MANHPPSPPTKVKINGKDKADDFVTKSTGTVTLKAQIDDPDKGDKVRLIIEYSGDNFASQASKRSSLGAQGRAPEIDLTGLSQDTKYTCKLWTEDEHGKRSLQYSSAEFWTNRRPAPPTLVSPSDNQQFADSDAVFFDWKHVDLDDGDNAKPSGYSLQYRIAATPVSVGGPWTALKNAKTDVSELTVAAGAFQGNTFYEWQVRTRDAQNAWGDWSQMYSFYVTGTQSPPALVDPVHDSAVDVSLPYNLTWRFRDPDNGDMQTNADVRWRVVGTEDTDWITVYSTGAEQFTAIPAYTFQPNQRYEWQVRTYDTFSGGLTPSAWPESATFRTVGQVGALAGTLTVSDNTIPQGVLGCGEHRVFVYDRGGMVPRGEITPIAALQWSRKRDDISNAVLTSTDFGQDCCELLGSLRSWVHELVIFRDGERVFEGPVTRITYKVNSVEIEAKDVMAYVYRRVLRQGYSDAYHLVNNVQQGLNSVVYRASRIIMNALAYQDPNVLPYLTAIQYPDDAVQSRVVPDYSRTAWEEIDDLAATGGLDYVTIGRRIMLWDTHRAIGKLPEMRDGDFSEPPVVTEYGMSMANFFAVTNGGGGWGSAIPLGTTDPSLPRVSGQPQAFDYYGPVEQLASAYGESDQATPLTPLTAEAQAQLRATLDSQAALNINHRWPTPLVARVPDNASLNPNINLGINQLVPGVWIPLRATGTCREVGQWQKLDSVTVSQDGSGGEQVQVVMSPAPAGGLDEQLTTETEGA